MKTIFCIVLITVCYVFSMVKLEVYRSNELNSIIPPTLEETETEDGEEIKKNIEVSVTGEVLKPGKYTLKNGSTMDDLIKLCKLSDDYDENCINLDCILEDKITYYIPKASNSKISINDANNITLDLLPGVGLAMADRIISYRDENGPFNCLEDVKKVDGIKDMTFNKIRDFIKL